MRGETSGELQNGRRNLLPTSNNSWLYRYAWRRRLMIASLLELIDTALLYGMRLLSPFMDITRLNHLLPVKIASAILTLLAVPSLIVLVIGMFWFLAKYDNSRFWEKLLWFIAFGIFSPLALIVYAFVVYGRLSLGFTPKAIAEAPDGWKTFGYLVPLTLIAFGFILVPFIWLSDSELSKYLTFANTSMRIGGAFLAVAIISGFILLLRVSALSSRSPSSH